VTVNDTKAPTIWLAVALPPLLAPANNKMQPVIVAPVATDTVSAVSCKIASISGNDGATSADWQITGDLTANLRAKHSPHAIRTYTLTIACKDRSNNTATANTFVLVP
jgi:hypothetical protein